MPGRVLRSALLLLLAAAVPASLWGRGRPGVALASALAFAVAVGLPRLFASRGLRFGVALEIVWLLPFAAGWGLGEGLGLFERLAWWDHLAHLLGGLMAFSLFDAWARTRLRAGRPAVLALGIGAGLAVGASWEIGEFLCDRLLATGTQADNLDTMLDLVWDGLGATLGALGAALAPPLRRAVGALRPFARGALLPARGSRA